MVRTAILAPKDYVGTIMELCQSRRGTLIGMDYLGEDRVEIKYMMPLGEIVFDFFDHLKSKTAGYASLDYEPAGEKDADLVKVDILLQGEAVDAFSAIVHREKAYAYGLLMTERLKKLSPRQQFEVPIRPRSGPASSRVRRSRRCAKTFWPSATAVTSPASASCSRSRRKARRR
jgi:GTP-binding protein LepA